MLLPLALDYAVLPHTAAMPALRATYAQDYAAVAAAIDIAYDAAAMPPCCFSPLLLYYSLIRALMPLLDGRHEFSFSPYAAEQRRHAIFRLSAAEPLSTRPPHAARCAFHAATPLCHY